MKPIKKVVLKDAKVLSSYEMKNLFGGSGTSGIKCKVGTCNLYIHELGVTVSGICKIGMSGGYTRCYCKNGKYSSDPNKESTQCTIHIN